MEGQILTKQVTIDDGPLLKMSMQKLYILKTSPPVGNGRYNTCHNLNHNFAYNFYRIYCSKLKIGEKI